jgi:hypothetical protein
MDTPQLFTKIFIVVTLVFVVLITITLYRKKEYYSVDISGGFSPPCPNCGDCVAYTNCPNKK